MRAGGRKQGHAAAAALRLAIGLFIACVGGCGPAESREPVPLPAQGRARRVGGRWARPGRAVRGAGDVEGRVHHIIGVPPAELPRPPPVQGHLEEHGGGHRGRLRCVRPERRVAPRRAGAHPRGGLRGGGHHRWGEDCRCRGLPPPGGSRGHLRPAYGGPVAAPPPSGDPRRPHLVPSPQGPVGERGHRSRGLLGRGAWFRSPRTRAPWPGGGHPSGVRPGGLRSTPGGRSSAGGGAIHPVHRCGVAGCCPPTGYRGEPFRPHHIAPMP
mmetsp:Transcript_49083/g.157206  ORF Transcript_49083/g.157206 Transcript_49083/m.157206 type:complete len:269 (-) Transcript_49083:207-1013(-)